MRGSREISLVPSLHRASTDALIRKQTKYADDNTFPSKFSGKCKTERGRGGEGERGKGGEGEIVKT